MIKNELSITLSKFGFEKIENEIIEAVFFVYDQNHSGFIYYMDFCNKFYEYANEKRVKDESDWSYSMFETIRKNLRTNRKTLASMFDVDLSGAL
jgi:hypothetical protein